MTCKLCLQNKTLKKSHIIPKAFYKPVNDKKNRTFPISMDNTRLRLIQSGITEKLLCGCCEQKFSRWENILKKTLTAFESKKSKSLIFTTTRYPDLFKVNNIQYQEFKLGILSILWRMSIASNNLFESYDLDNCYKNKLRKLLLSELLVKETEYPIKVTRYETDGKFHPGLILTFKPDYFENSIFQSFVIWGHHFRIMMDYTIFSSLPIDIFLRKSGELYVDVDNLPNLAAPDNVFAKLWDKDVQNMYSRLKSN